ncbi:MAG: dihydrofolate reductase family protein [Chloroflexota bacterium]
MTRKVILQIDVTLDGFIAAADGDTSWVTTDDEMNQDAYELLTTADTILLGRVAYQAFSAFWPFADVDATTTFSKITRHLNEATKLVFSKTLKQVEWGRWNNAQLIHDNIPEEINKLKAQPGQNLLLYAGADIISTFMHSDLIDEYHLRVQPVIVGGGKSLFQHIENQTHLKLVRTKSYKTGVVLLEYQRP